MRLYALYNRSNKILGLMAVFFLAELSVEFYTYISFDSPLHGWPRTFALWEVVDPV